MKKVAFIFPGQGSQSVGMGRQLAEEFSSVAKAYERLDSGLGFALSQTCFEGPEESLLQTAVTQPAIVATSTLLAREACNQGLHPYCTAGHSVGEYSALVAAGVLDMDTAVGLVRLRGQLMDEACPQGTGSMAALIGLNEDRTREYIASLSLQPGEVLDIAGLNCPGQTVVAGHHSALQKALNGVRDFGGRMGVALNVSGPFHSALMAPAEAGLSKTLGETDFKDAQIHVYPNTTAEATRDAQALQNCLMAQLTKPVLWEQTVRNMLADGVESFVEFGAGNVLAGMIRKIDRKAKVHGVHNPESLQEAVGELLA